MLMWPCPRYITREPPAQRSGYGVCILKNENAAAAAYSQLKHKAVLFKGPVILTVWTDDESGKTCRDAIERSLKNEGFRLYQAKP
jgi:hypothetical protein